MLVLVYAVYNAKRAVISHVVSSLKIQLCTSKNLILKLIIRHNFKLYSYNS
jgi:hypothetical protein